MEQSAIRVQGRASMARILTRLMIGAGILLSVMALVVLPSSSYGRSISVGRKHPETRGEEPWAVLLREIVSDRTVESLKRDEKLRRSYVEAVSTVAEMTRSLADKFEVKGLLDVTRDLDKHVRSLLEAPQKRQFLGLPGFPGSGSTSSTSSVSARAAGGLGALLGGGGNMTDIIGNALSGLGSAIGGAATDVASGAGMFLGIGLGQGAAQGLNLATAAKTKQVGAKVAADNNMTASGLNPAIQNAAMGATSSLLGSVNVSSLVGGNTGAILAQAAPALLGLGQGLGGGTAMGLKLTQKNMAPTTNTTDIAGITSNFGFGLTDSLLSAVDVNKLLASTGNSGMTQQILAQLPAAASGLGTGLGSGASMGLGLTQKNLAPSQNSTDVGGIISNFGFGLSSSVTSNLNTTQLIASAGSGVNTAQLMQLLPAAASGLGKGLGEGAAIGLGLQPDSAVVIKTVADGQVDVGGVVQSFAQSMTSSFLQNDTLSKLTSSVSTSSLTSNVDIGKAASGFARGFIQGAGDSVESMGGIGAIINGTATMPTGDVSTTQLSFNDSVGGAATGFGQGLGSQGVLTIQKLLANMSGTLPASSASAPAAIPASSNTTARRSLSTPQHKYSGRTAMVVPVYRRQTQISSSPGSLNLSLILTPENLSTVMQKGLDVLTTEGVGGLGLIGLGLINSGTITLSFSGNTTKMLKGLLPQGTIRIQNGNMLYEIDGIQISNSIDSNTGKIDINSAANGVAINGTKVISFAAFLAVHIILAIVVLLNIYPIAVAAESAYNLLQRYVRLPMPKMMTRLPKINNVLWLFIITPSVFLILIFGILANGNAAHFKTAHGILGLISILVGFAAVALHVLVKVRMPPATGANASPEKAAQLAKLSLIRMATNQILLLLVTVTSLTGFGDLSVIAVGMTAVVPFELAVSFGVGLGSTLIIGTTISGLELMMSFRESKMVKKGLTLGALEEKAISSEEYVPEKKAPSSLSPSQRPTQQAPTRNYFAVSRWSKAQSDI